MNSFQFQHLCCKAYFDNTELFRRAYLSGRSSLEDVKPLPPNVRLPAILYRDFHYLQSTSFIYHIQKVSIGVWKLETHSHLFDLIFCCIACLKLIFSIRSFGSFFVFQCNTCIRIFRSQGISGNVGLKGIPGPRGPPGPPGKVVFNFTGAVGPDIGPLTGFVSGPLLL